MCNDGRDEREQRRGKVPPAFDGVLSDIDFLLDAGDAFDEKTKLGAIGAVSASEAIDQSDAIDASNLIDASDAVDAIDHASNAVDAGETAADLLDVIDWFA